LIPNVGPNVGFTFWALFDDSLQSPRGQYFSSHVFNMPRGALPIFLEFMCNQMKGYYNYLSPKI